MEARQLGRITRELHDALSSSNDDPDFAPALRIAPTSSGGPRTRGDESKTRSRCWPSELGAAELPDERSARAIVDDATAIWRVSTSWSTLIGDDAGQLIRHHGDYHLGQVLRTRTATSRSSTSRASRRAPLAERRERSSALRDVAGMLRSFAYAAATLAAEQRSLGAHAERRATEWERGAREAFSTAIWAAGTAPTCQRRRAGWMRLRELFETEKVFYELSYELNNRPAWVWIPIAGVSALRAAPSGAPMSERWSLERGATVDGDGTRFSVWAPNAKRVEVVLDGGQAGGRARGSAMAASSRGALPA